MAELAPMPLIAVYSATKVCVDFFSRGLQSEYEDKGIDIQVLHTGPVLTDMFKEASAPEDTKTSNFMVPSPGRYAKQALSTLGFTSATTGYWPHAILSHAPFHHTSFVKASIIRMREKVQRAKIKQF